MKTLILALALVSLTGAQARPVPSFDPAGKWTYSTADDSGQAATGTMEITGKPGAYTGTIQGGGDPFVIKDVFTSPNGAAIFANMPDGGIAVIKMWKEADGSVKGSWVPVRGMIPATLTRSAAQ